jgi:hypothetical protein
MLIEGGRLVLIMTVLMMLSIYHTLSLAYQPGCLKRSIRYVDNSFRRGQRTQKAVVERFPGTKFANP